MAEGRAMLVSSRANASVKQIRGLRARKAREETGRYFIEGIRLVAKAVELGAPVETVVLSPEGMATELGRDLLAAESRGGPPCLQVTAAVFETLILRDGARGVGAVLRQQWEPLADVRPEGARPWIALDEVRHPGNLGTILRTGEAVGGAGVFLLGDTTDPYDPVAVRASLGTLWAQRLVRTTLPGLAAWKATHGCRLIGTSPGAALDYRACRYEPPLLLFMGSERCGLSPEMLALCDAVVRIPMLGQCDSLNLAVSASLVLYQIFDQRERGSG
jgi:TrmH family RNA methyltransferase